MSRYLVLASVFLLAAALAGCRTKDTEPGVTVPSGIIELPKEGPVAAGAPGGGGKPQSKPEKPQPEKDKP
jgi:hypothetical protein